MHKKYRGFVKKVSTYSPSNGKFGLGQNIFLKVESPPRLVKLAESRVARWCIFKPKIPVWKKFGGPWNGKYCYIL
jgi:hypothetical protein